MADKVTFDGDTKLITVLPGVSSLNSTEDVYSPWKRWVQQLDNAKYQRAFNVFGGEPTVSGQFSPVYTFLLNSWQIFIDGATNPNVDVAINLYVDSDTTNQNPFLLSNSAVVSNLRSDVGVVESELQDTLDYASQVVYDEVDGQAGGKHPTGTAAYPVNNSSDLIILMDLYDINSVKLQSNMTVNMDITNTYFYTNVGTSFLNPNGHNMNNCFFERMRVDGEFSGSSVVMQDCFIGDISGVSGVGNNCHLDGTIYVSPHGQIVFSQCASGIAGTGSPVVDMHPTDPTEVSFRSYSGGIKVVNLQHVDDKATIEFVAGKCHIGPEGCTDGYISVRGAAVVNNYSSGTTVDTRALTSPESVASAVLDEYIAGHNIPGTLGSFIRKIFWRSK